MRTRKTLAVLALGLALAGCGGQEAGPTPKGGGAATTPDALATKLRVYSIDQCATKPEQQIPSDCRKFVTELASTVGMVREQAPKHPQLNSLADTLQKGIDEYRGPRCDTVRQQGNPCSEALRNISNAVRDTKQVVDTQLMTS